MFLPRYIVPLLFIDLSISSAEILFTAFGDFGRSGSTLDAVVDTLNSQPKARFSVLLGDLAYPDGFKHVGDQYCNILDSFANSAESFYIVLGNHDYRGSIEAIREYVIDNPKFCFPKSGKAKYHAKRLKLTNGYGLCMLFIDTMHLEPPHIEWMHEELGKCGGRNIFRLVFGHYPIFSVGQYSDDSSTKRTRDIMEPIMDRYGVHAYIGGHEHHLQAFESKGRHYIISGAVAELNRNGVIRKDIHQNIVKFAYRGGPGFANFRFIEDGRLEYTFVDAADEGSVLYKASIKITDAEYIGDADTEDSEPRQEEKKKENKKKTCDTPTVKPSEEKEDNAEKNGNVKGSPKPVKDKASPKATSVCDDPADDAEWEDLFPDAATRDNAGKSIGIPTMKFFVAMLALCTVI